MFRALAALPAYFGGKRRLLGAIFGDLPPAHDAPVFVDPFLGGGSVSLYAKARGYLVRCNDLADRSVVIGRALIENDRVTLGHDDLVRLAVPGERTFAAKHLAPDVFPAEHAVFLGAVLENAATMAGPKRWLAQLVAVKHALRLRPMGNFGAKTIVKQAAAGQWEDMNPHYVKDLIARGLPRHPIRLAEQIRRQVNAGVFSNGLPNETHQGDAVEFLKSVEGDICYLDPPYSGTLSYEKSLKPLDELLAGESLRPDPNPYSSDDPADVLPPLLEAASHIPVLGLSYGNAKIDLGGLMDIVRQYRPIVEGRAIQYTHCTGLAGDESRQKNQELLVIGRPS